jgi:hypothetical protein
MAVLCGRLLTLATGALPQWREAKWGARQLRSETSTCLICGNEYSHIMVFVPFYGSLDLEILAILTTNMRGDIEAPLMLLTGLWTCLSITVAGLKQHTWYWVAIGAGGIPTTFTRQALQDSLRPLASNWQGYCECQPFFGSL